MPLRGERRSRISRELAQSSRAMRVSSSLTGAPSFTKPALASTSEEAKRSSSRRPTMTCWKSGTGRFSSRIVVVSPRTVASHSPNSSALETVAERDTSGHRLREVDDDLLPHRPAHPVGEVVHLVHDHEAEAEQRARPGVEHVAQHLGGHHDHRCLAVDHVVAGQQADLVGAVALHQVVVLLVGQRLDRRRVERLAPGLQRQVDGELAHDRLAGPGRGSDEHAASVLDLPAGAELEVVELEAVEALEVLEHREGLLALERGVALGGRGLVVVLAHQVLMQSRPARRGRTRRSGAAGRSARRRRTTRCRAPPR